MSFFHFLRFFIIVFTLQYAGAPLAVRWICELLKKNCNFRFFLLTSCTNVRYAKLYTCKRSAVNLHKLFTGDKLCPIKTSFH
jgi:hypothetical protein